MNVYTLFLCYIPYYILFFVYALFFDMLIYVCVRVSYVIICVLNVTFICV